MSIPSGPGGMFPIPNGWLEDNAYDPKLNDAMRKVRENFEKFQIGLGSQGSTRVSSGSSTITIPNTNFIATGTINHSLNAVPASIVVTGFTPVFGSYYGTGFTISNPTLTTFDVTGYNFGGYASGVVVNVYFVVTT
jgi:hypothetical protein